MSNSENYIEPRLYQLLPHRVPMLLINSIVSIGQKNASALVTINEYCPFYQCGLNGVPSWIGLEYMGQTAALMAGQQLEQGELSPHLGILLGSRSYTSNTPVFKAGNNLIIECQQTAIVGDSLVNFHCTIGLENKNETLAEGTLSVLRTSSE